MSRVGRLERVFVAVIVVLAVTSGVTGAQETDPAWADDLYGQLQDMAGTYNENVGDAKANMSGPTRQVYNQLQGKRVNVYFAGTDVVFSFRMTRAGEITDFRQEPRDDAQLAMYMTRDTAERLAGSDAPVTAFVSAVQNGKRLGDDRVRGVVIRGESGHPVQQATWTVINAVKGLVF